MLESNMSRNWRLLCKRKQFMTSLSHQRFLLLIPRTHNLTISLVSLYHFINIGLFNTWTPFEIIIMLIHLTCVHMAQVLRWNRWTKSIPCHWNVLNSSPSICLILIRCNSSFNLWLTYIFDTHRRNARHISINCSMLNNWLSCCLRIS